MLAALIASQSLVTFVAAAPAPPEKAEFVVNVPDTLYKQYPKEVESIQCYIAKDDKNACLNPSSAYEIKKAVEFLAKHNQCKAINSKIKIDIEGEIAIFTGSPLEAYCYFRAGKCDEIAKADLNRKSLVLLNAACYGVIQKGKCEYAIDPKQCRQFYQQHVDAEQRRIREWEEQQAEQARKLQQKADEEVKRRKGIEGKKHICRGLSGDTKISCCQQLYQEYHDPGAYHLCKQE